MVVTALEVATTILEAGGYRSGTWNLVLSCKDCSTTWNWLKEAEKHYAYKKLYEHQIIHDVILLLSLMYIHIEGSLLGT